MPRSMTPRLLFAVVLAGLLAAAPGTAQAQPSDRGKAVTLFRQGNKLFKKKDYAAALEKFEQAYRLRPNPKILVNIGLTNTRLKRLPRAALAYERFLQQADMTRGRKRIKAVRSRLKRIRRRIGCVSVMVGPEGSTVKIGGQVVGQTPLKNRIYLMPGAHQLLIEKQDFAPHSERIQLKAGDHRRVESTLKPAPPPPKVVAPVPAPVPVKPPLVIPPKPVVLAPATQPAALAMDLKPAPAPDRSSSTPIYKKWWFWTAVGVAVVGAATAGVVASQTGGSDRLPEGHSGVFSLE